MIFFIDECEKRIGYKFKDKTLLRRCFTHRSYAHEQNTESYENLEYFGDAILDYIVAEYLFLNYPNFDEGDLTKMRADIVSAKPLAETIKYLELEKYVLLGEGEKNTPVKPHICADLFESVLCGIYLDGGLEQAKTFVFNNLLKGKRSIYTQEIDFKSKLQELVQKNRLGKLSYRVLEKKGPDHAPEFKVGVYLDETCLYKSSGSSKKSAEQRAAKEALKRLKNKK